MKRSFVCKLLSQKVHYKGLGAALDTYNFFKSNVLFSAYSDAQEGDNKAEGIVLIWSAPETKKLLIIYLKTWIYCFNHLFCGPVG